MSRRNIFRKLCYSLSTMSKDHINPGASVHWNTPNRILTPVRDFFNGVIDLDPASNDTSIVGAVNEFSLPETDGLLTPWDVVGPGTRAYINPPFGKCYVRDDNEVVFAAKEWTTGRKNGSISDEYALRFRVTSIKDWINKANVSYGLSAVQSLMLIPAAVDTAAWQKTIFPEATCVCFIKGRISFIGGAKPGAPAPMATALVGWVDDVDRFLKVFKGLGTCLSLVVGCQE